jgi:hypothetical protein
MKVIVHMTVPDLQDLQVCGEGRITTFIIGNGPGHHHVLFINPGLHTSNLDVAAMDLLFGTHNFKIFICCLSVGKGSPLFGEDIMVGVLEDFELGEGAVINNCRVLEEGTGQLLKGRKVIVAADCIMNCNTVARECLCNMLVQFIP